MEISLGLDLKGGMNVILEVSVPDVIKVLADNKTDEAFNQALATAAKQATTSQDDVITLSSESITSLLRVLRCHSCSQPNN